MSVATIAVDLIAQVNAFKRDINSAADQAEDAGRRMQGAGVGGKQFAAAMDEAGAAAERMAKAIDRDAEAQRRIAADVHLATDAFAQNLITLGDYETAIAHARAEVDALRVAGGSDLASDVSRAELAIIQVKDATDEWLESARSMRAEGNLLAGSSQELALHLVESRNQIAGAGAAVEASAIKGAAGVGQLNRTLVSLLRQATNTHPALAQLASVVGTFAVGSGVMVAVLAGGAAIAAMWRNWSEEAREARRRTDEARASLERLIEERRKEALGPAGVLGEQLDTQRARMEEIQRQIESERQALAVSGVTGADSPRIVRLQAEYDKLVEIVREGEAAISDVLEDAGREAAAEQRARERAVAELSAQREAERARIAAEVSASASLVQAIRTEIEETRRLIAVQGEGAAAVQAVTREIERERAVRAASTSVIAEHRAEAERLAGALVDETHRLEDVAAARSLVSAMVEAHREANEAYNAAADDTIAGLQTEGEELQRLLDATRQGAGAVKALQVALAGEAAVQALGAKATEEHAEAARQQAEANERLRQSINAVAEAEAERRRKLDERQRQIEQEAAAHAQSVQDAWLAAINSIGQGLGGLAQQLAGVAQAALRFTPKKGGGVAIGFDPASAAIAAIPTILGGLLGNNRSKEIRAAQRSYEDALDAFVDGLTDRTRWEQIEKQAADQLADLFEAAFRATFEGRFKDPKAFQAAIPDLDAFGAALGAGDFGAALAVLRKYGAETEALTRAMEKQVEVLTKRREAEIADAEASIEVRTLAALGLKDEAEALQRSLDRHKEMATAADIGGQALVDLYVALYALEDAALATAKAADEVRAAMASAEIDAMLLSREMDLWGSDLEAVTAALAAAALAESNRVEIMLAAGEITEDQARRWLAVIAGEMAQGLADFEASMLAAAEAAKAAEEAERARQAQMYQDLQLRLLVAQGMDQAAWTLRNQIELEKLIADGADAATVALLGQVQAAEAQARAMQNAAAATSRATAEIDRMATVLNAPSGFRSALRIFQASGATAVRPAVTAQSVDNSISIDQITIQAAPGDDGAALVDKLVAEINRRQRIGGVNPLASVAT